MNSGASAFVLIATAVAFTADADDAALQGVFIGSADTPQRIDTAVDAGAKQFNFLIRPIVRSRLKKVNPAIRRIEIIHTGKEITIKNDASIPITAIPGSGATKWKRDDGEVFDLSMEWQGASLEVTFVAPDGKRVSRYTLSGNTLALDVTLTSPELRDPIRYHLDFRRAIDP
jgi:hypothetical protein